MRTKKRSSSFSFEIHPAAQRELDCIPIRAWREQVGGIINSCLVGITDPPKGLPMPRMQGYYYLYAGERYMLMYAIMPKTRCLTLLGVLEAPETGEFTFH